MTISDERCKELLASIHTTIYQLSRSSEANALHEVGPILLQMPELVVFELSSFWVNHSGTFNRIYFNRFSEPMDHESFQLLREQMQGWHAYFSSRCANGNPNANDDETHYMTAAEAARETGMHRANITRAKNKIKHKTVEGGRILFCFKSVREWALLQKNSVQPRAENEKDIESRKALVAEQRRAENTSKAIYEWECNQCKQKFKSSTHPTFCLGKNSCSGTEFTRIDY